MVLFVWIAGIWGYCGGVTMINTDLFGAPAREPESAINRHHM